MPGKLAIVQPGRVRLKNGFDDMIIKNLLLKNYRRFRKLELELPQNLIGIIGNNGVGKTTIIEAIGWVLYGNRIKRTDKQDIRSQFCENSDTCTVEMEFVCQGNEYRVIRQLKGKTAISEVAIYRNGNQQPEAVQERGVNDFIEQLLNLDYRSFFVSVFARQKDLAALSLLQPEERRRSIARLINIDTIDTIRNQIRSDKNIKKAQKEGMAANLKDEKEMKTRRQEIKTQLTQKTKIEKQQQQKLKQFQHQLIEGKKKFEALNKLRDQYLHLKSQLDKWEDRLTDFTKRREKQVEQIDLIRKAEAEMIKLKARLKDYQKIKQTKESLDIESTKQAAINATEKEKQRLAELITKKQSQFNKEHEALKSFTDIEQKAIAIEKQFSDLENLREKTRQELTKVQAQKEKTVVLGKEISQRKTNVEQLGDESPCPVCTRPLGEHYDDVITHFEKELTTLREQWKEFSQTESNRQKKIDEIDASIKSIKQARDQLIRAQEQFREQKKSLQKLESDLAEWHNALRNVTAEIAKIGKVKYDEALHQKIKGEFNELTQLHEQSLKYEENVKQLPQAQEELEQTDQILNNLQTDIISHKEKLKELTFDEHKYLSARKKVDEMQQQVDEQRESFDNIQREIISVKKDLEKIDGEIDSQKKLVNDIKEIEEELHYLVALDHHFGIFRQELAGRIRPIIARRASDLLHLTTNGRYSMLELDEDYNIYLYDQTERFPLIRFSGGEQDLANLCIRIAISQVVAERAGSTQINFIVLDEIFGSQDEERKALIMNTLQHLSSQFRQIFVITHVEEIKDVLPEVIAVEEKDVEESVAMLV